jgi:hypothetical protein
MKRIWPRASARGTRKSTNIFKPLKNKKTKNKSKHTNENKIYFYLCAAISSENGQLNGCAFTDVFENKYQKCCIK